MPVKVYNFAVMDYHTYYAGEDGVLVHNTGCKKAVEKMSDALEEGSSRGGNDAANKVGVDRKEFGNYIHEIKKEMNMRAN